MKFKDFQAPVLFSSTFKTLNLGEKTQVLSRVCGNPVEDDMREILNSYNKRCTIVYRVQKSNTATNLQLSPDITDRARSWSLLQKRDSGPKPGLQGTLTLTPCPCLTPAASESFSSDDEYPQNNNSVTHKIQKLLEVKVGEVRMQNRISLTLPSFHTPSKPCRQLFHNTVC